MATATENKTPETSGKAMSGGSFLIANQAAHDVFTPEDLTQEHLTIARTTREFYDRDVAPYVDEIERGNKELAVAILRKAAALGLESVLTPEKFGGMGMDLMSV